MENNNQTNASSTTVPGRKKKNIWWIVAVIILICALVNETPVDNGPSSSSNPVVQQNQTIPGDSVTDGSILSKTVMIYMDGADLEELHQSSTRALQGIFDSGVDMNANNILIYTGGSNLWHGYGIPTDKDCIYLLRNGKLNLQTEYAASNMGAKDTLQRFMEYCVNNFPAQQYGLILQDHGGGPNYGVCSDFRNNQDTLSTTELQSAFLSAGFGPSNKMEFIIFDACLMASVEVASCMKNYAHYMIGSENVSYTYGSDYSFMRILNTKNSSADIGTAYVNSFFLESNALSARLSAGGISVYDVTYSCLDLSKMDALENALDNFFRDVNNNYFMQLNLSLGSYDARGVNEYTDSYGASVDAIYDLIDLKDWISQYEQDYPSKVRALNTAIDNLVVCNQANTPKMNGVTIYYPHHINGAYSYDVFDFSEEYSKYIKSIYQNSTNAGATQQWNTVASLVQETRDEDNFAGLSVQLTEDQVNSFGYAEYYIFAKQNVKDYTFGKDEYVLVTRGDDVALKDGYLKANYNNQVPVIKTDDGEKMPFCSSLIRNKETGLYNMHCGLQFFPDEEDFTGIRDEDGLNVLAWQIENMKLDTAVLTLKLNGQKLEVVAAQQIGQSLPTTVPLDISTYDDIEFINHLLVSKVDSQNKLLPVSQWTQKSEYLSVTTSIDKLEITMEDLNSDDVQYFGMMVITDVYGNQYSTEMQPLKK